MVKLYLLHLLNISIVIYEKDNVPWKLTQECNLSQVHILHLLSLKFCFYIQTTLHISTSYITIVLLPIIYLFCKAKVVRRKSMKVFAQVFWIVFSIWVHIYKCKACTYVFNVISLQSTCLQIHTTFYLIECNKNDPFSCLSSHCCP